MKGHYALHEVILVRNDISEMWARAFYANCLEDGHVVTAEGDKHLYHMPLKGNEKFEGTLADPSVEKYQFKCGDRVLVRDSSDGSWTGGIFKKYCVDSTYPYATVGGLGWRFCIPFEGNEKLAGTANQENRRKTVLLKGNKWDTQIDCLPVGSYTMKIYPNSISIDFADE